MTTEPLNLTDHEILSALYSDWQDFKRDHLQIRKSIYGNGATGLIERHNALSSRVSDIIKVFALVGGLVLTAVFGLLWNIFTGKIVITFR